MLAPLSIAEGPTVEKAMASATADADAGNDLGTFGDGADTSTPRLLESARGVLLVTPVRMMGMGQ